jgi:hypothetical protein
MRTEEEEGAARSDERLQSTVGMFGDRTCIILLGYFRDLANFA